MPYLIKNDVGPGLHVEGILAELLHRDGLCTPVCVAETCRRATLSPASRHAAEKVWTQEQPQPVERSKVQHSRKGPRTGLRKRKVGLLQTEERGMPQGLQHRGWSAPVR